MVKKPIDEELEKRIQEIEQGNFLQPPADRKGKEDKVRDSHLKVIIKIGALVNSTLDLEEVLQGILKSTLEAVNASAGMIFLKDSVTGCLSWGASFGLSKAFISEFQNKQIQVGEGLSGQIVQTGEPIYIPVDSSHDPRIARPLIKEEGLNSFIGVPIYAADKIVGVMNILTHPPDMLSKHDMALCEAIGSHVGLAIRNAQLFDTQKQIAKELKESEHKLATHLQNTPVGAISWDLNFKTIDWNPAAGTIFGYSKKEAVGKHVAELIVPEESKESLDSVFHKLISEKGGSHSKNKNRTKDGRQIICDWYNTTLKNGDGKVIGVASLVNDITERERAEEDLKASEEKYRSMMEAMKNAAYICSSDLVIEYMNPKMISRVGRDGTGEFCYKAIYERDEQCSWCLLDKVLNGEHVEYELADPKDNRYYSITNSPIYHSEKRISKLTIFHDITENKAIEAQLRQARKMESIGTLAGGIAHDFNNILYLMTGNAELAMEDIPEWNPVHDNLKEIKAAGLRAAGIVKQLLNFSRKTDQEMIPIEAVTVIKDALKFLRSTIPTTIEIRKSLPDDDIVILADSNQINQVIMNLCINASQAMEETGGILEISIEKTNCKAEDVKAFYDLVPGNYLKITVSDTGTGISPEIINRIFDPYFTTREIGKGSGMGLAVVQGIVKNHNGAIRVDSSPGKGSSFILLFPMIDKTPAIEAETDDEYPSGTETILFVDDEKAITDMTKKVLEKLGYKVETCLNPNEALDLFLSKPDFFNMVITDMTMPQMTGAVLSEKLKEIRSDIPVIICTGHSSLIDDEKVKRLGIDGYLTKPVLMSTIAKEIRKIFKTLKKN